MIELSYEPDGENLTRFLLSDAPVNIIQGPWGSGKSTVCCYKLLQNALNQPPGKDGMRRRRAYVVRNTFDELKRTTIKTWLDVFPEDNFGRFTWSKPFEHKIRLGDLDWEVIFLAMEDDQDRRKLLSAEISDIWFNEAREIERGLIDDADGRLGRFPAVKDGGCLNPMMIGDTNAPREDHWMAVMSGQSPMPGGISEEKMGAYIKPKSWRFFIQPPGMIEVIAKDGNAVSYESNPGAENRKWLRPGYYESLVEGKDRAWIRVNVLNRPGQLVAGKPVFHQFRRDTHVSKQPLKAMQGHEILVGIDFGRTPAAIWGQRVFDKWRILGELVAEDMGARAFARILKHELTTQFPGHVYRFWGDPAGEQMAQADDISPFLMFRAEGLPVIPAPSNDPVVRVNAVNELFSSMMDGQPRCLISSDLISLISACEGGYHYRRLKVTGERYQEVPEKNMSSHPADAFQYLLLGGGEGRTLLYRGGNNSHVRVAPRPKSVFQRHGRAR